MSPIVSVPVVVRVPEMLLLPMVPPETVMASAISSSTQSNEMVPPSVRAVESTLPLLEMVSASDMYALESEEDALTRPAIAWRGPVREFASWVVLETVRLVVEALVFATNVVVVAESVSKPVKCEVDDAWSPAVRKSGVPVEFVVTPKFVVVVKGYAKMLFW